MGSEENNEWMAKVHNLADGKTRRVSNTWRQIKMGEPEWLHDQYEYMHMERNTFQRILLVNQKPSAVAATLFVEGEVEHRTWTSNVQPRLPHNAGLDVDNSFTMSRACYRERIIQLERHYRVNHMERPYRRDMTRQNVIDEQAERGREITGKYFLVWTVVP